MTCDHCGRETGPAYGSVTSGERTFRLCHTSDSTRPDCYHRVTVYHEVIGFLLAWNRPCFEHTHGDDEPAAGCLACFYDVPGTVCVTHKRFVPCRAENLCVCSCRPDDVEEVRRYQSGKLSFPLTN